MTERGTEKGTKSPPYSGHGGHSAPLAPGAPRPHSSHGGTFTAATRPGGGLEVIADPEVATCVHDNPNALTRDIGTSRPAQGGTGQLARVEVEPYDGPAPPPPVQAHLPPPGP